ncbi:MAG: peptidoglycan DD-metalloendopeptidase family protein [Bryobacterales bacterium]|nr:peptidoglycan DD-metalloendopeptidase family protein [Bryobacterales bacterium]
MALLAASGMHMYAQQTGPFADIPKEAFSRANAFVLARGGEAFLYNYEAGVAGVPFLPNVYKAFGFSHDSRYFLYLKANGRFPSFALYCYDLRNRTEKRITRAAVHQAVWSPAGPMLAYMSLDASNRFHVSVYNLELGQDREAGSGPLRSEYLEWSPDGAELLYMTMTPLSTRAADDRQYRPTLHRYSLRQGTTVDIPDIDWAQYAGGELWVSGQNVTAPYPRVPSPNEGPVRKFVIHRGQIYVNVIEGGREVVKRWNGVAGTFDFIEKGRLYASTERGLVVRDNSRAGIEYKYVDTAATKTSAQMKSLQTPSVRAASHQAGPVAAGASTTWKLPFDGWAYMVQGGNLYQDGSCDGVAQCFLTAHFSELGYALDWIQMPENGQGNTHILAVADGTVAAITNNVTCNSITTTCSVGWDDFSNQCNDPNSGAGNYVAIAHLDGSYSFYAHLKSGSVQVTPGQNVVQGTHIADQGHSGSAGTYNNYRNCGDHLHFSRQIGPGVWDQSIPTDFEETPCLLGCASTYQSSNFEIAPAPSLAGITPASAPAGFTVDVTLTGTGFVYGSTVNVSGTGVTVSNASLASGTQITATLSIGVAAVPGTYNITVTTRNGISNPAPFTVTAAAGGGALTGTVAAPSAVENLSQLGTSDWAHWGLSSNTSFNHKAGVSQQISNYTPVGGPAAQRYTDNPMGYSWTGGTPTASITNTTTGIWVAGLNRGFRITAPADTTVRTLKVFVGIWNTQGKMVAQLSDNSAPNYTDTSLNSSGDMVGVYTFNYRAASAGQTLTITFTQNTSSNGTITLQAAALSGGPVNPDFSLSASPSAQSVVAGSSAAYTATVSALSGFTGNVSLSVSGLPSGATASFSPSTVAGSGSSTLTINTSGGTAPGSYPLTITGASGALSHTAGVTLNVTAPGGGGGALAGSVAAPSPVENLTQLGTSDWAHWGLSSNSIFNHKAGVPQQISNYTPVGGVAGQQYSGNLIGYAWTDGTPTASATYADTGLWVSGLNRGFRITAPADTSLRTLKVFVGVWNTQGKMVAQLSDNSAPDYTDTSLNSTDDMLGVYTFNYRAASSGQTLTITFTQNSSSSGNINLQAAALSGGPVNPDFSLSASPSAQSVVAGSSAAYTATVSALSGFTGNVSLSVSGLPSGATASFSPSTVAGSGSSTLTINTSGGTAPGSYPLTITGASGALSHTAGVTLNVTAPADFSLSASPSAQSVVAGSSAAYTATVSALSGFTGNVSLSVSGLPSGATASFSPSTVAGSGSSTLTINTSGGTAPGSYPLTITGASGALSHTAGVTLNVTAPADFSLSASPSAQSVVAGSSAAYTATVSALSGFTGNVSLSVSGLPSGATASFSPSTVAGSGSSTLTINTSGGTAPGSYPLTITGASGALSHTAGVTLNVTAPADFSLSASPSAQSVVAGSSAAYTATVSALSGFTGNVSLSVSGLPSGATASFSPSTVAGSGSSTLTINTSGGTAPGSYPLTITGASGALSHTAGVTLNVTAPADFSLSASPSAQSVVAGSSAAYTATVSALSGFTGNVSLSVSGLPSGATASFSPSTVAGSGSSTLTINTSGGTAPGSYPLTITGASGALSHTAGVTLNVTAPADFSLSASPSAQSVVAGSSAAYTATVSALSGFTGNVSLSVSGLPSGATASFSPSTVAGSGSSTLTINTSGGTAPGSYPLTITGASGALSHTAGVTLNVTAPGGGGGALAGSVAAPSPVENLTQLGTSDWAHWGLSSNSIFNHKAGVPQQISNYTPVGGVAGQQYSGNLIGYAWTDGTPTASATYADTGLWVSGLNRGFRITAPADTSLRTLKVFVGVWNTQGKMVAQLSDNSAPDYTDTSLNSTDDMLGVYTFNYRAASSGQTLTITFTQNSSSSGNINLQAAALSGGPVNPDFSLSASPSAQSVVAGSSAAYTATVSALSGFTGNVSLSVSGLPSGATASFSPSTVAGSGSSTLTINTSGGTAPGSYPLTITGASGALSHTAGVTLHVTAAGGGGGALAGSVAAPSGTQQLNTLGTLDWAHWGRTSASTFNHKAGVPQQISNYTPVGGAAGQRYTDNPFGYSWSGGTPTASANNTTTGLWISGLNRGFRITVPADTTTKVLKVFVGAWNTQGKLVAHLSDNSAPDYADTSLNSTGQDAMGVYTINFRAASAGQTLTVTFTQNTATGGNINWQAAALSPGP